jgi:hypothetical protein
MATKPLELPPKLAELHAFLTDRGDVEILAIYGRIIGGKPIPLRSAQQYLGPYITKLNRRLREHRQIVRPGRIKGTYCLVGL